MKKTVSTFQNCSKDNRIPPSSKPINVPHPLIDMQTCYKIGCGMITQSTKNSEFYLNS